MGFDSLNYYSLFYQDGNDWSRWASCAAVSNQANQASAVHFDGVSQIVAHINAVAFTEGHTTALPFTAGTIVCRSLNFVPPPFSGVERYCHRRAVGWGHTRAPAEPWVRRAHHEKGVHSGALRCETTRVLVVVLPVELAHFVAHHLEWLHCDMWGPRPVRRQKLAVLAA